MSWICELVFQDLVFGHKTLQSAAAQNTVTILVLVDSIIFFYLIKPDVERAFDNRRPLIER